MDTWSEGYKKEKEALFKYYPQYYHKTDKVRLHSQREHGKTVRS